MSEFKVGDRVYCPHFSTNVLTLVQSEKSNNLLAFEKANRRIAITKVGKMWDAQGMVADIVHATPETHALLERLYGVEFEVPPVKLTSREIIQAMLARGDKYVPCWVSDGIKEPDGNNLVRLVVNYREGVPYPYECSGSDWKYATPFDIRTGEEITELPE